MSVDQQDRDQNAVESGWTPSMGQPSARAESIVHYMELIAPSEAGAVTALRNPDTGDTMIMWNLLPPKVFALRLIVAAVEQCFIALVSVDGDGDEADSEPTIGEPSLVATFIHTDDEIARKIIVYGAQALDEFRSAALRNQSLELAQITAHFHDLIQDGLKAWGAGNTSHFVGASPKLQQASSYSAQSVAPPRQGPRSAPVSSELRQVQHLKSRTGLWILVNVGMIFVAIIASIATYQDAVDNGGGTYLIWWGPVVWGVINLFRFGSRMVKLSKLERELSA